MLVLGFKGLDDLLIEQLASEGFCCFLGRDNAIFLGKELDLGSENMVVGVYWSHQKLGRCRIYVS